MSENFFHIRTKDTFATMKLRVDIVTHNDSKIFDYTYFLPHLHYPNYLSMKREVIDQYLKKLFVQTSYPLHIKTHRNCVHGDSTWQRNVTVKYKKRRETTYNLSSAQLQPCFPPSDLANTMKAAGLYL